MAKTLGERALANMGHKPKARRFQQVYVTRECGTWIATQGNRIIGSSENKQALLKAIAKAKNGG